MGRLNDVGVCAHAYRDMESLWDDPVVVERNSIIESDHQGLGRGREIGIAARFASRPDRTVEPAARPGWHSRAILLELGYSEEQINDLLAMRVTAEAYPDKLPLNGEALVD